MASGLLLLSHMPLTVSYVTDILPGFVLVGFGITLAGVPLFIAAVSGISEQETGLASGLINTSQQIGAAVVLAVLIAVATAKMGSNTFEGVAPHTLLAGFRLALQFGAGFLSLGSVATWNLVRSPTRS